MENNNLDEKDGVATKLQIGEIQMKTHGRKFESSHADQIFTANETPDIVGKLMVKLAGIESTSRVLEPSAGKGKLSDVIREVTENIVCVELNMQNCELLRYKIKYPGSVYRKDFLKLTIDDLGLFDFILMCPPKNSMSHVEHALKFLKSNGKLIGLVREDSEGLEKYKNFYFPLEIKFMLDGEPVPSGLLFMEK